MTMALKVWNFVKANCLPFGLIASILLGLGASDVGQALSKTPIPWNTFSIVIIFIITGIRLDLILLKESLKYPRAAIFSTVFILFGTSLLAVAVKQLPLTPRAFSIGFSAFLLMPTTISGGILATTIANGHVPLSVTITVLTNFFGIFTVPLLLQTIVFNGDSSASVNIGEILLDLFCTVLLPLTLGKLLVIRFHNFESYCKAKKGTLTFVSNFALCAVPFFQVSNNVTAIRECSIGEILMAIFISIIIHIFLLVILYVLTQTFWKTLQLDESKQISTIFMCSQKSISIGVSFLSRIKFEGTHNIAGLILLPFIFFHLYQTVIDSFLASYIASLPVDPDPTNPLEIELLDTHNNESSVGFVLMQGDEPKEDHDTLLQIEVDGTTWVEQTITQVDTSESDISYPIPTIS